MKKILCLSVIFVAFAVPLFAGPISDVFSDSVFGVKWTDDLETVKRKFPGGKVDTDHGYLTYEARDGREILKTARTDKNKIIFTFNAIGTFRGVGVEFPYDGPESFAQLLNTMNTYFGAHTNNESDVATVDVFWPTDNGINVKLIVIPEVFGLGFNILMSIDRVVPVEASKEELGF
ncbi:hypothetical protein [Prosthecochloris sp.]|uniref:hypothetical protein n=1 Tax=Prosthecochloris sp. TaxID=290513 RepID=UPI0025F6E97D|nr:hypothetical protein [Prosthecochloris sp.]